MIAQLRIRRSRRMAVVEARNKSRRRRERLCYFWVCGPPNHNGTRRGYPTSRLSQPPIIREAELVLVWDEWNCHRRPRYESDSLSLLRKVSQDNSIANAEDPCVSVGA